MNDETRKNLEAVGAVIHGYFPYNAVLAELTPAALSQLENLSLVQAAFEYLPTDKIQPFLSSLAATLSGTERVQVAIQTLVAADVDCVAAAVKTVGGEVVRTTTGKQWGTVQAIIPISSFKTLAAKGEVQWIEEYVSPGKFNDKAAIGTHLNTTNVWATWGLTGKGQIVGHADTGLDTGVASTIHPDFKDRIVAIIALGRVGDASDTDGHGTHTAGSILGNGSASAGQYRGMAYEARLVHQSVMDASGYLTGIGDIYELFAESYAYGARIHSDSWGADTYGAYDSECRSSDLFAWDNPDHLAVFACGNAGVDTNRTGVVATRSVGSPAAAKNVVTVGASENDRLPDSGGYSSYTWGAAWPNRYPTSPISTDYLSYSATTSPYRQGMAAYSSRGPTEDGRIKPDVIAPGTDVISTKSSVGYAVWTDLASNSRYCFGGGTSMATPLTAGSIALLRQYAVERGGVTNPSAALLKAMLVGGSRSLSPGQYGTGTTREIPALSPNNVEGWGQPDIANTVYPTNRMVRLYDRIEPVSDGISTFAISVVTSNTPLDIALAWIDYPATPGTSVTLVNDLDLLVVAPNGTVFYPNGGTARDSLNTVETLRLVATKTGTYQIMVIGYNVPYSGGAAALYVRGAIDAPPALLHTPISSQLVATPCAIDIQVQSLFPLTNGQLRVVWATGNASTVTGIWQTAAATWLGGTAYHTEIPGQAAPTYLHYYLEAVTTGAPVRLPKDAPVTPPFLCYIGNPAALIVDGSPLRIGTVAPAYGTNTMIAGFSFSANAPSMVVSADNTYRSVCKGWTGSGDVPSSGTSNQVTLTLTHPSSIIWQWATEYPLTKTYRQANIHSVFDTQIDWVESGTLASTGAAIELGFLNGEPYALAGWSVDGVRWPDATSASPNPATGILMNSPRSAQADYLPFWLDTDGNSLSDWWESRYFGSTNSGVSATADLDGDGWTNLGEFLDNSDPRDPTSTPVPPTITVAPLDSFQTARPPWTVFAAITDNLSVEVANLVWRERGDLSWTTNVMTWVQNNTYAATLNPPSHGSKRVDYFVSAGDLIGYYESSLCSISSTYHVIGDYDSPWINVSPETLGPVNVSTASTNLSLTVSNFAGPDLTWTARVAYAEAPFAVTNASWAHSGDNDVWCMTTNRTWNGDPVWYCGNQTTRVYPDACHAMLNTPPFSVGPDGGLLFRQWISTEYDSDNHYWDGATVSVSTDGGATFTIIEPTTGYPYLITENQDSPFPANQPCLAGNGDGWETLLLDLSAYAGQTVIVRFEFGSDGYTVSEGWYVANVVPFSFDRPAAAWLTPQGRWGGALPDQWNTPVIMTVVPSALAYNEEALACIRVESNDPTASPIVPVTVRRGHTLTLSAIGPGTAITDRTFLFRDAVATATLQADSWAYISAITSNGVPLSGIYDFSNVSKILPFTHLSEDQILQVQFAYRTWTLTVTSAFSTSSVPSLGTHTLIHGTAIDASILSPITTYEGLTRLVCSGWTLSGQSPSQGTGPQALFTLTNNASLCWLWQTNYYLSALSGENGTVNPTGGWYNAGQSVCVTSLPPTYYHSLWSGDTDSAVISGIWITVPMTHPRTVTARFEPNVTATHGVPEYWLASYGLTGNFESNAENDADADGMATWKEWYTNTDPTNALSLLRPIDLVWSNGFPTLTWIGGVTRTQLVQRATTPSGTWQTLLTNTPPTPITNTLPLQPPSTPSVFYRISVQ